MAVTEPEFGGPEHRAALRESGWDDEMIDRALEARRMIENSDLLASLDLMGTALIFEMVAQHREQEVD